MYASQWCGGVVWVEAAVAKCGDCICWRQPLQQQEGEKPIIQLWVAVSFVEPWYIGTETAVHTPREPSFHSVHTVVLLHGA